jgi:glycosyltransferase involved in cell wall biosynthesis
MGTNADARTPAVSVAMATYNGAAFIYEQLASIGAQTLAPYEIVICDDGSSDDTLRIIQQFKSRSPLPVHLHRNDERLGAAQNFARAIALCEGELIALADQDDVWLPEKLARLSGAMPGGAPYAFCDATVIDAAGAPSGHRSLASRMRGARDRTLLERRFPLRAIADAFEQRREVALMMKRDFIYGTTLMFRAPLRESIMPIPGGYSHDTWIVNVLACLSYHGVPVLEPLVRYRRHDQQASGGLAAPVPVAYEDRVAALEELYAHVVATADRIGRRPDAHALALIDEKLVYLRALVQMPFEPLWRRPLIAAGEVASGRWRRYTPRTFR